MDYRLVWSDTATLDLKEIVQFIATDNQDAALNFGSLIIDKLEQVVPHPYSGRIVPEEKNELVRELILSSYRIVYEIEKDHGIIHILRIWHSSRGKLKLAS